MTSFKAAVLRAYELVTEAYRQKFRSQSKSFKQTCVEFARERVLFEKWCLASRVVDFEQLQELLLSGGVQKLYVGGCCNIFE